MREELIDVKLGNAVEKMEEYLMSHGCYRFVSLAYDDEKDGVYFLTGVADLTDQHRERGFLPETDLDIKVEVERLEGQTSTLNLFSRRQDSKDDWDHYDILELEL